MRLLLLGGTLIALIGCGGGTISPVGPSPHSSSATSTTAPVLVDRTALESMRGLWQGDWIYLERDSDRPRVETMSVEFAQDGVQVTGVVSAAGITGTIQGQLVSGVFSGAWTLTSDASDGPECTDAGALTGAVTASGVTLRSSSTAMPCRWGRSSEVLLLPIYADAFRPPALPHPPGA